MEGRELLVLSLLEERSQVALTATTSYLSPDSCPVTYDIDWGDGSPPDSGTAEYGVPFSVMHPYRTEGATR